MCCKNLTNKNVCNQMEGIGIITHLKIVYKDFVNKLEIQHLFLVSTYN